MRFLILMFTLMLSTQSVAGICRNYTDLQIDVIHLAFDYGKQYNYQYTLAAIVVKESFVGNRIIRYNPNDPSTGVTHIQFETLKHLSGLNHWDALELAERLITDDTLSLEYSVLKLNSISGTFWNKWVRYNGSGERAQMYARDIQAIINGFKRCGVFEE